MKPLEAVIAQSFLILSITLFSTASALAQARTEPRLALKGYDPVAYFTEQRPMRGAPEFRHDWDDVRYQFASAKNRSTFAADPDRYVPQFSAFCTWGLAMGKTVEADPNVWKIVGGKLYVFSSPKALEAAAKDPNLLPRAHQVWHAPR